MSFNYKNVAQHNLNKINETQIISSTFVSLSFFVCVLFILHLIQRSKNWAAKQQIMNGFKRMVGWLVGWLPLILSLLKKSTPTDDDQALINDYCIKVNKKHTGEKKMQRTRIIEQLPAGLNRDVPVVVLLEV